MIKTVIEILKERPFVWLVLFVSFGILLFSPLIELWSNNLIVAEAMAWLKITLGIAWVISGVATLFNLFNKLHSFIKTKLSLHKIVKKIINLSYEEKLLLFLAVKLTLPIVPVPRDNRFALILAEKRIIHEPNPLFSRTSLGEHSFKIPDLIWDLLTSKTKIIFKEFLSLSDKDLEKEFKKLLPEVH